MLMKKFIGKPYAGKPHVRIDEGAGRGYSLSRSTLPINFAAFARNKRFTQRKEEALNPQSIFTFSIDRKHLISFLEIIYGLSNFEIKMPEISRFFGIVIAMFAKVWIESQKDNPDIKKIEPLE